jgi:hypothetical protein
LVHVLRHLEGQVIMNAIVAADEIRPAFTAERSMWRRGRRRTSAGTIQALFYPGGLPLWVLDGPRGNVHDLAAARENVLPVLRDYTGEMSCLADCGYEGTGQGVLTPAKKAKGVTELDINADQEYAAGLGQVPG